jgi:hypothetical protein
MASSATTKTGNDVTDRISKIDAIISAMQSNSGAGSAGLNNSVQTSASAGAYNTGDAGFVLSTADGSNLPCVGAPGNSNCPSTASAIKKMPGWNNTDPNLQKVTLGGLGFVDMVTGQRGVTKEALLASGSADANIVAATNALGKAQKQVNSQLVAMNKPPIDFNKATADMANQLNQVTDTALQKAGTTPAAFLASMGRGSESSAILSSIPEKAAAPALAKKFATSPAVGFGGGSSSTARKGGFSLKEDKPSLESAPDVAATDNSKLAIDKGDVSKDSGASIFNIISERYLKSGFAKLLDEDPVQVPQKK